MYNIPASYGSLFCVILQGHRRYKTNLCASLPSLPAPSPSLGGPTCLRYEKISFSMRLYGGDLRPAPTASNCPLPAILRRESTIRQPGYPGTKPKRKKSESALKIVNTTNRTLAYTEKDGKVHVEEGLEKQRPCWKADCLCGRCLVMKGQWDRRDERSCAPPRWELSNPSHVSHKFRRRQCGLIYKQWEGYGPIGRPDLSFKYNY